MSPRKKAVVGLLFGLVLGAAAGSWGQRALFHHMMRDGRDPKRMLEKISGSLSLDEKQKTAVAAVFERRRTEVEALKKETFERLGAIHAATDVDMKKILTPEQAAKLDAFHRGRRPRINWEAPDSAPH